MSNPMLNWDQERGHSEPPLVAENRKLRADLAAKDRRIAELEAKQTALEVAIHNFKQTNKKLEAKLKYAHAPVDKGIPQRVYDEVCRQRDEALSKLATARLHYNIDSGSPEAEARDRLAVIGFAEVERRLATAERERDEARAELSVISGMFSPEASHKIVPGGTLADDVRSMCKVAELASEMVVQLSRELSAARKAGGE